jgi:hypothetical protein
MNKRTLLKIKQWKTFTQTSKVITQQNSCSYSKGGNKETTQQKQKKHKHNYVKTQQHLTTNSTENTSLDCNSVVGKNNSYWRCLVQQKA